MSDEVRPAGRGGPGRGQGRKQLGPEPTVKRSVTLPPDLVDRLTELGRTPGDKRRRGNLSRGIREAVRRLDELEGRTSR
jgi:hypothetical protein